MNIVLLGSPGGGKGTQARFLVEYYNLQYISTGDLVRKEIDLETDISKKIQESYKLGKLIDTKLILTLVEKVMACNKVGFLFDGFPRTIEQAESLNLLLKNRKEKVNHAIYLSLSDEVIFKRILGRFMCESCNYIYNSFYNAPKKEGVCDYCGGTEFVKRSDDDKESLIERLKNYHKLTEPLKEFYEQKKILTIVDAEQSIDNIKHDIFKNIIGMKEV
ncbi:MAG: adenylate kinase family protein [Alphaproteobacteria bacterium]